MPEGDTVWLTARHLHDAIAGQTLTRTDFRVPAWATVSLVGCGVTDVLARGKHLLVRLDDGTTVHAHLRMDGSWRAFARGTRWRGGPTHAIRLILSTAGHDTVGYRLHDVAIVRTADEDSLVGHLGPDLLGADWDPDEAVRRLAADPSRPIGEALLDQRALAGVGNLYKAEVLFLRGLDPWTPVGRIDDLAPLVRLCHRLLRANRDSFPQVTTGNPRPGEDHYVFERGRRPCRRCGTAIVVADQGPAPYERITYWCPCCQPPTTAAQR